MLPLRIIGCKSVIANLFEMQSVQVQADPFFISFREPIGADLIPDRFALLVDKPHPLCMLAIHDLQLHLHHQQEWEHNFGLSTEKQDSTIIGKMFGVLAVKTQQNEVGYLSAFSGKLAGGNHHSRFVPPVFDGLTTNSFLNNGMQQLNRINAEVKQLVAIKSDDHAERIKLLKAQRKTLSITLQKELFDNYYFLNRADEEKSLNEIFKKALKRNPPSGAGECAAPKLLQYAFQHKMKPLALAEFWWGQSPKSEFWKHGHYYPCCKEKCEPILAHMLEGIDNC